MDFDLRGHPLLVIAVIAAAVFLVLAVIQALIIVPLLFLGILFGILLRSMAYNIEKRSNLPYRWAYTGVVIGLVLAFVMLGVLLGPRFASQIDDLTETIPESVEQIEADMRSTQWGEEVLDSVSNVASNDGRGDILSQVTGVVSSVASSLLNVVIVIFLGAYMALEPSLYRKNFVRLFPEERRPRVREVLDELYTVLLNWLAARLFSMVVVAALTFFGLMLLGMPIALALAVFAGLISFIPNVGPVLAMVPALLLAFSQGFNQMAWVFVLYNGVQFAESYFITPSIQRYTISLPPALTLGAQVVLALIFGTLGLLIAAPAVAGTIVLVKMLYVEDVQHQETGKLTRT